MTDQTHLRTRSELLALFSADTQAARLARLRRIGVIDEQNRVTERAQQWGKRLSHTAVEGDDAAE